MNQNGIIKAPFEVEFKIAPVYYNPIKFKDFPHSFQWSRVEILPLNKLDEVENSDCDNKKKKLDDPLSIKYNIPAKDIDEAIENSKNVIKLFIHTASFYYNIGFRIVGPPTVIDVSTGNGVAFDFHRLKFSKENFCTKKVDCYFPFGLEKGEGDLALTLKEIVSYTPNHIFEIDNFSNTVQGLFEIFKYVGSDIDLKSKIDFALEIINASYQVPNMATRFTLYWTALERLIESKLSSGLASDDSINKIGQILASQKDPILTEDQRGRVLKQIKQTHNKSTTHRYLDELEKYFLNSRDELKSIYGSLSKTRHKIIHPKKNALDDEMIWKDTQRLFLILKQIVKVNIGYEKISLVEPELYDFRVKSSPNPKVNLTVKDEF